MIKLATNELAYFPTKKQMLTKIALPKVDLISNHYKVNFSQEIKFDEWHMRFFSAKDEKQVLVNPDVLETSVAADSRVLVEEVLYGNASEISKTFGKYFHSGLSLFTFSNRNKLKNRYVLTGHKKHLLVIDCKHRNVDLTTLDSADNGGARSMFIRLLNAFLKSNLAKMGYKAFGRTLKFYDMREHVDIPNHHLHIYKGFTTSIDMYENGIKLLVDYSTKIVRSRNIMQELVQNDIDFNDRESVKEYCVGMLVMASYGNNRVYRIDDVDFGSSVSDPFPNTSYRNYEDYFAKRYKTRPFQYKNQFLLVNKKKYKEIDANGEEITRTEIIKLVPELMLPTGLTDNMRKDYNVMRDLGYHTILKPDKRFPLIDKFTQRTNKEISANKDFNFVIDTKSNKVTGYMIRPPKIRTGLKSSLPRSDRINVDKAMKAKNLDNWVIVFDPKNERDVKVIVQQLKSAGDKFGVKIANPCNTALLPRNATDKDFEKILSGAKQGKPDIVFFFITKTSARTAYKKAKKYLQRKGVVSQFFTGFNPNKDIEKPAKFMNLVSQMIVKMGGSVWELEVDLPDTMIAGADVYHGPKNKSVASLVTQWGKNFSEFFSVPKIQKKGVEIMHNMASMVLDSIKQYKNQFKKIPKNFIFFRDGVGERQLDAVMKFEIKKIRETLDKEYKADAPKLLFVVVTKRLSDRFAVVSDGRLNNPDGGVVVLDNVVKTDRANFFLVAQRVNQGTATPTHYEVIYNDTSIKLEELVELAYQFTFGYSNWMGPVKVPAPVQYAHKQAALIGVTQDDVVNQELYRLRHYM